MPEDCACRPGGYTGPTTGRVTFNAELLAQPQEFRKRVIVEELLHLRVPGHGRLFRALLRAHLANPVAAHTTASEM